MVDVQCETLKLNFNYGLLRLSPKGELEGAPKNFNYGNQSNRTAPSA